MADESSEATRSSGIFTPSYAVDRCPLYIILKKKGTEKEYILVLIIFCIKMYTLSGLLVHS